MAAARRRRLLAVVVGAGWMLTTACGGATTATEERESTPPTTSATVAGAQARDATIELATIPIAEGATILPLRLVSGDDMMLYASTARGLERWTLDLAAGTATSTSTIELDYLPTRVAWDPHRGQAWWVAPARQRTDDRSAAGEMPQGSTVMTFSHHLGRSDGTAAEVSVCAPPQTEGSTCFDHRISALVPLEQRLLVAGTVRAPSSMEPWVGVVDAAGTVVSHQTISVEGVSPLLQIGAFREGPAGFLAAGTAGSGSPYVVWFALFEEPAASPITTAFVPRRANVESAWIEIAEAVSGGWHVLYPHSNHSRALVTLTADGTIESDVLLGELPSHAMSKEALVWRDGALWHVLATSSFGRGAKLILSRIDPSTGDVQRQDSTQLPDRSFVHAIAGQDATVALAIRIGTERVVVGTFDLPSS